MADSYSKKERERKKRKTKQDKLEKREKKKLEGKTQEEFMYLDANGHLTTTPQDLPKSKIKAEDIELGVPKRESSGQKNYQKEGRVKFFNTEKGYGFVIDEETDNSYFVHVNNLETEIDTNDKVTFEVGSGPKGPIAINVQRKGG